jgi:acetyltransferase-like isoleucine patch superfamily enzyme
LGSRCYVAAYAYVTDILVAGDDCTINPYAVVRGSVTLGDGVRIGAHASLLGFNHSMDPAEPGPGWRSPGPGRRLRRGS